MPTISGTIITSAIRISARPDIVVGLEHDREPRDAAPRAASWPGASSAVAQRAASHFFCASPRYFAHSPATSAAVRLPSSASWPPWIESTSAK